MLSFLTGGGPPPEPLEPPPEPLEPPPEPLSSDAHTKLLLHGDEFDAVVKDSSTSNHSVNIHGAVQHSTAVSKIGGSSLFFAGAGDYLSIPVHDDFAFGTEPFTVDFWIYLTGKTCVPGGNCWVLGVYEANGSWRYQEWSIEISGDKINGNEGKIMFLSGIWGEDFQQIIGTQVLENESWYHIAVVREGSGVNQTKIYINGSKDGEGTIYRRIDRPTVDNDHQYSLNLMAPVNYAHEGRPLGYLDEVRISKGVARWTENFTTLTEPYKP